MIWEKNLSGPDETRTRDLLRDRQAKIVLIWLSCHQKCRFKKTEQEGVALPAYRKKSIGTCYKMTFYLPMFSLPMATMSTTYLHYPAMTLKSASAYHLITVTMNFNTLLSTTGLVLRYSDRKIVISFGQEVPSPPGYTTTSSNSAIVNLKGMCT